VSDYYDTAHFIVTLSLLGFLWWRRADIYRPLCATRLVLVNVNRLVVFWRFPVAPRGCSTASPTSVATTGAFGSWHSGSLAAHANQVAAMAFAAHGLAGLVHGRGVADQPAALAARALPPSSTRA